MKWLPIKAGAVGLSILVLALWVFPAFWYAASDPKAKMVWLAEQTQVAGWNYEEMPVAKSAESVLVADQLISGQFTRGEAGNRERVQVFSAKRYAEKENNIGLFVHTPDRCWTQAGWRFEPVQPDMVTLTVHGIPILFERRIFVQAGERELVYFGGMVGGQPLPYRLDHNLSVGMKYAINTASRGTGTAYRASDTLFWRRVWDSFTSRRPLLGPKQFVRVSTSVRERSIDEADALLQAFIPLWLQAADYQEELERWRGGGEKRNSESGN
jgi:hypothetical protein